MKRVTHDEWIGEVDTHGWTKTVDINDTVDVDFDENGKVQFVRVYKGEDIYYIRFA